MSTRFKLYIEPEALADIQNAVDFYNSQQPGLGVKFFKKLGKQINILKTNYSAFAVRYDDIRCMPLSKYPFMIHYRIVPNSKVVIITALFSTHIDPVQWHSRE